MFIKKNFKQMLVGIALMVLSIITLISCNTKVEQKVTFMIESDNNWIQYQEVTIENGTIEMPKNPEKDYYTFNNWYLDKDFSGDVFKNENLKESTTVYARFTPIEVKVHINGNPVVTENLVDVVNGIYNPGEGLEFDGWYTNANYSTKWDGKAVTNDLYAKSVAAITFNDGYKDVYKVLVNPNTVYESPKTNTITEKEVTSTVEEAKILQPYMSKYDISYTDSDGNAFDFTKAISKSITITVNWRSPYFKYQKDENTGELVLTNFGSDGKKYDDTETEMKMANAPVLSILSTITFDDDGDGVAETYHVEAIRPEGDMIHSSDLKKIIIGEGIKMIQGLDATIASSVEEVVIPSSVKVIQNSFNNMNKLKGITIPEGVEVIIGSFFANTASSYNGYISYNQGDAYDFDIEIPNSVKNLSMVPSNLVFSHTKANAKAGDFYKDGDKIYKVDDSTSHSGKLLLIADFNPSDAVTVPEGVNGVQVGTYFNRTIKYLNMPSTFEYVGLNESIENYPYAKFQYSTTSLLWNPEYALENKFVGKLATCAFGIYNNLQSTTALSFKGNAYPEGLSEYAFTSDPEGYCGTEQGMIDYHFYEPYNSTSLDGVTVFLGETDTPVVKITISNDLISTSYDVTIGKNKGQSLTVEEILTAIDSENGTALLADYKADKIVISKITNFGENYDLSASLSRNVYLDIIYNFNVNGGYNVEKNNDGNAIITGYDGNTAVEVKDGLKLVSIPENVVINGETLAVTKIKENAFVGAADLGYVILPSTLKKIGASAFKNVSSLVNVDTSACKLVEIGSSAFEGTSITSFTLALSELKSVGAYAFKSETLTTFNAVAGEENRTILEQKDLLVNNGFYFVTTKVGITMTTYVTNYIGLVQYVSTSSSGEGENLVRTHNVKYIATAGIAYQSTDLNLGEIEEETDLVKYEVMEGSIYYLTGSQKIFFYCVSKIHTNAITDSTLTNYRSSSFKYNSATMGSAITGRMTVKDLINDVNLTSVFEENWYDGYTEDNIGNLRLSVA